MIFAWQKGISFFQQIIHYTKQFLVINEKLLNYFRSQNSAIMIFSKDVGTLQDVIQYFNTHPTLFEREDYDKGHMERVMAVLTQQNMEHLQKQFQLYSRGLELPTFIYLIKKLYIPDHEMSKYFFVSDLIKFFQAIDINGDGHLQWSQFTQYIIQNIRVVEKPKYKNKVFEQNQIISSAYSKISNQYRITKIYDLNCQSLVKKIIYLQQAQQYYVIESQTYSIKIFDKKFQPVDSINLEPETYKSTIIDFSIDKQNCIVGCIFEESLFFCNMKLRTAVNFVNREASINYKQFNKMQYLSHHKIWAVTNKSGQIHLASVSYNSRTIMNFKTIKILTHHELMVTDIIQIDDPMCIVSSSMDGEIKLYSKYLDKCYTFQHIVEQTSSVINERKKKGILGISYSSQFGNYMLSFGFSNHVYIYSLDISLTKGYAGKYSEHTGTIMWAKFLKSYPYVLSFDDKLNLRIWDFRKFNTIQFVNCQKIFINPSKLQIIPELFQVLICQKKVTQFRAPALQKKSKQINEFHNIFDFKFCPLTNHIYVFTSNDVRIYNYYTGSLKKLFTKLYQTNCQTNITACQFGFKCRRFFVGDAGGFVRQFCSETGQQLQNINPGDQLNYENKQIVKIIFLKEHSLLVCCSIDGRIMIYERDENGEYVIIRDIRECHEQFVCAAASSRYCLLATAGEDGGIVVWNLQKYVMEGMCVVNSKPVGIAFSPIHPIMVVATEDGFLNLFYVRPYEGRQKYKCFAKISINQKQENEVSAKITSFYCELIVNAYFPKGCLLNEGVQSNHHFIAAVGTDTGKIIILNLNKIIADYNVSQNHQIHSIKSCHRCEVQVMKSILINQRNRVLLNGYSNAIDRIHHYEEFIHFSINASEGPIENLLISKESSAIFCKSVDKKLKVWSFKNEYNGAINFATFKKIFWKIPEVNFYKKLQSIDTTIYSIKLIQNKKFKVEQENKIKVHLLLNQYLNNKQKQQYCQWLHSKSNAVDMTNIVKPKIKKIENQGSMSQQQFNQIYSKLKNSIEKSLSDFQNTEKIFWEKKRSKSKAKALKQSQITEDTNKDEKQFELEGYCKSRGQLKRNTKREENCSTKCKTNKSSKFDACFQLFGRKTEEPLKKAQSKKKNLLFTPLSTAKKIIMSNCKITSYR